MRTKSLWKEWSHSRTETAAAAATAAAGIMGQLPWLKKVYTVRKKVLAKKKLPDQNNGQFQSLKIRQSTNFMQVRNVDRLIFWLEKCWKFGRARARTHGQKGTIICDPLANKCP